MFLISRFVKPHPLLQIQIRQKRQQLWIQKDVTLNTARIRQKGQEEQEKYKCLNTKRQIISEDRMTLLHDGGKSEVSPPAFSFKTAKPEDSQGETYEDKNNSDIKYSVNHLLNGNCPSSNNAEIKNIFEQSVTDNTKHNSSFGSPLENNDNVPLSPTVEKKTRH